MDPKSRPSAAKTAYRGPQGGPGPPVEAQEQLKIANIGPKTAPRPAQDRTQRPQERPKTTHTGESTSRSTSIEDVEDKYQRKNMLPVNLAIDHPSNI